MKATADKLFDGAGHKKSENRGLTRRHGDTKDSGDARGLAALEKIQKSHGAGYIAQPERTDLILACEADPDTFHGPSHPTINHRSAIAAILVGGKSRINSFYFLEPRFSESYKNAQWNAMEMVCSFGAKIVGFILLETRFRKMSPTTQ